MVLFSFQSEFSNCSFYTVTMYHSLSCFFLSAPLPTALTRVGPDGTSVNTTLPNDPDTDCVTERKL